MLIKFFSCTQWNSSQEEPESCWFFRSHQRKVHCSWWIPCPGQKVEPTIQKEAHKKRHFLNLVIFPCIQVWSPGAPFVSLVSSQRWWPPTSGKTPVTRAPQWCSLRAHHHGGWTQAAATGKARICLSGWGTQRAIFLLHSQGYIVQTTKYSIHSQKLEDAHFSSSGSIKKFNYHLYPNNFKL